MLQSDLLSIFRVVSFNTSRRLAYGKDLIPLASFVFYWLLFVTDMVCYSFSICVCFLCVYSDLELLCCFSAQPNMDVLNGDVSLSDDSAPVDIEDVKDEVATSCILSCDMDSKNVRTIKPTNRKQVNKPPSSGCLDSERGKWLLAAARRVRDQKQRPNVNRIMNTLRIICPDRFHSRESLVEELELAVSEGILLRVGAPGDNENCSYRDPGRVVRLKTHSLHVTRDLDLTKVVARSVRELADPSGSTMADVHHYLRSAYKVHIRDDSDLMAMITKYCQKAVEVGKLVCTEDSGECRYQPVYNATNSSVVNFRKAVPLSSSLSSYSVIDRAFKTDVSESHLLIVLMSLPRLEHSSFMRWFQDP